MKTFILLFFCQMTENWVVHFWSPIHKANKAISLRPSIILGPPFQTNIFKYACFYMNETMNETSAPVKLHSQISVSKNRRYCCLNIGTRPGQSLAIATVQSLCTNYVTIYKIAANIEVRESVLRWIGLYIALYSYMEWHCLVPVEYWEWNSKIIELWGYHSWVCHSQGQENAHLSLKL